MIKTLVCVRKKIRKLTRSKIQPKLTNLVKGFNTGKKQLQLKIDTIFKKQIPELISEEQWGYIMEYVTESNGLLEASKWGIEHEPQEQYVGADLNEWLLGEVENDETKDVESTDSIEIYQTEYRHDTIRYDTIRSRSRKMRNV